MIYTSYFSYYFHRIEHDKTFVDTSFPIAICVKNPSGYVGASYPALAPINGILAQYRRINNVSVYMDRYNKEILTPLSVNKVVYDLFEMSEGKDVVLLCYEKADHFCHRFLVSDWLKENGYYVEELK